MMTIAALRSAIIRCAAEATQAEPRSVEFRLHSFIAKLSGSFGFAGEAELDAAVWALLEANVLAKPGADDQAGIDWWNSLTEERRWHWLSVAGSVVPADAWRAFLASENALAVGG